MLTLHSHTCTGTSEDRDTAPGAGKDDDVAGANRRPKNWRLGQDEDAGVSSTNASRSRDIVASAINPVTGLLDRCVRMYVCVGVGA